MKVFVFDPLWPSLITPKHTALLKKAGVEVVLTTKEAPLSACKDLFSGKEPRLLAVNPDYVGWSLPAERFDKIPHLQGIITASTAFGWIDVGAASQKKIPVANIRNFSTDAVADWAVMMMLNVARKVPLLIKNEFPLNYASDFQTFQGTNLKGKTAGIIGLGNIGYAIAERCKGLGMNVIYWNRSKKKTPFKAVTLAALMAKADVIFPTLAENDTTKKLFTDALLNTIRPSAMVISVTNKHSAPPRFHPILLKRVEQGKLYGYGFEDVPANFDKYKGNVWAAPTYAWCTDGSLKNSMDLFVNAIAQAAKGKFPNKVN